MKLDRTKVRDNVIGTVTAYGITVFIVDRMPSQVDEAQQVESISETVQNIARSFELQGIKCDIKDANILIPHNPMYYQDGKLRGSDFIACFCKIRDKWKCDRKIPGEMLCYCACHIST